MNMGNRGIALRVVALAFLIAFISGFVDAADGGLAGQGSGITSGIENASERVEYARDYIEQKRWEYIGEQWKGFFLGNSITRGIDSFFRAINVVFVVLFGHSYSLSLMMLLVFMLWLATFLSLPKYFFFIGSNGLRWLAALGATVIIAQLQIFNYISAGLYKLILFRTGTGWALGMFALILVLLAIYFALMKWLGRYIERAQEINKKKGLESRLLVLEAYQKGLKRARD